MRVHLEHTTWTIYWRLLKTYWSRTDCHCQSYSLISFILFVHCQLAQKASGTTHLLLPAVTTTNRKAYRSERYKYYICSVFQIFRSSLIWYEDVVNDLKYWRRYPLSKESTKDWLGADFLRRFEICFWFLSLPTLLIYSAGVQLSMRFYLNHVQI